PRPRQCVEHGGAADLLRHPDPGVVRLPPGGEAGVVVDRQRQVRPADQDMLVQPLQALGVEVTVLPALPQSREERLLVIVVGRERLPDGGDLQGRKRLAQDLPASRDALLTPPGEWRTLET